MKKTTLICLFNMLCFYCVNAQITPQEAVKQMARGINIGNTMEPPTEGAWSNPIVQEYYFDDYVSAGFTSVRIPITWTGHTSLTSPYEIDPDWLNRVEEVVDWGLSRGLFIIINAHHESWLKENYTTAGNTARFDSIWSQISVKFKDKSDHLLFEMLNEPRTQVTGLTLTQINELNKRVLGIIRKTNPTRLVVFSGNEWANSDHLVAAAIPDTADHYLIGYYHSYDPYPFGLEGPGTYGSASDINATKAKFDQVTTWSATHNIPVILGEFGATVLCDYNSRMFYYATVVEQALNHGVAFNVWDDGGNFGIYQRSSSTWNEIKDILIYTYNESPTNIQYTQIVGSGEDFVRITWQNRTTENDSITVERKATSAGFVPIAKLAYDATFFIDTSTIINKTYIYRLKTNIRDSIILYSYPYELTVTPSSAINKHTFENIHNIYPNPASENVTVCLKSSETNATLTIFDMSGKIVQSHNLLKQESNIDIKGLSKGVYLFKVVSSEAITNSKIYVK
jgi:aryl-phospho-beta-D-glucosidase BglC (GH1 family)